MSLYEQYETNKDLEKKGVWIPLGVDNEGNETKFKLARMGASNKKYQKALENATKPYRRQIELGTLSTKVAETLHMGVFLNHILLDWENVTDRKRNVLEFNKENAEKLFKDLPDLYEDLNNFAGKADLFREEQLEGDSKN